VAHDSRPEARRNSPEVAVELRARKAALGALVSLEMGKIRAEARAKCRR